MLKLEAIIQSFKLKEAKDALLASEVAGITVCEVRGSGRQRGHTEIYRGAEYVRDFVPKYKLEIVMRNDAVEKVCVALREVCGSGRIGDGMIFEQPVDDAIRVRTGERGDPAIEL